MPGALWRDVVNLIGESEPTPDIFWPIITHVAEHHAQHSYFLGRLSGHLSDLRDREDTLRELRWASVGHDLWQHQRHALLQWAELVEDPSPTHLEVEAWWLDDAKARDLVVAEANHLDDFLSLVKLPLDILQSLEEDELDGFTRRVFMRQLRKDLQWLRELAMLRVLARKTWPAGTYRRQRWTEDEFRFVDEYYADQQPSLVPDQDEEDDKIGIDPFSLLSVHDEQSLGFGLDGLGYCMYVIMRATVIDFMDEILETSRFPQSRGSLECVECGSFVGRRALGYGQLYCTESCKKRAAKRRYRGRRRPPLSPLDRMAS